MLLSPTQDLRKRKSDAQEESGMAVELEEEEKEEEEVEEGHRRQRKALPRRVAAK